MEDETTMPSVDSVKVKIYEKYLHALASQPSGHMYQGEVFDDVLTDMDPQAVAQRALAVAGEEARIFGYQ